MFGSCFRTLAAFLFPNYFLFFIFSRYASFLSGKDVTDDDAQAPLCTSSQASFFFGSPQKGPRQITYSKNRRLHKTLFIACVHVCVESLTITPTNLWACRPVPHGTMRKEEKFYPTQTRIIEEGSDSHGVRNRSGVDAADRSPKSRSPHDKDGGLDSLDLDTNADKASLKNTKRSPTAGKSGRHVFIDECK